MADQKRMYKVAEKVRGLLSQAFSRSSDPRFTMLTITSVVMSNDLRIAKVYWTVSDSADRRESVEEALEEQSRRLRREVAGELGTRVVPELKFFYDETLDAVDEVERLFQRVKAEAERSK